MFDALFLLSSNDSESQQHQSQKDDKYKLRVPLSVLIDYKGFRCIAIGKIQILPGTGPVLGFHQRTYQVDQELKSTFSKVGQLLHLKENKDVKEDKIQNNQ